MDPASDILDLSGKRQRPMPEIGEASALMKIAAARCRAGRILAGISRSPSLPGVAVVPATLITDYETGAGMPELSDLEAIQSALEWAGVAL
jgi:hypothetical protein